MGKARYLRIIGCLELVTFAIIFIVYVVNFVRAAQYLDGLNIFLNILYLIIILLVGPALGILFLSVANNIKRINELERKANSSISPVVINNAKFAVGNKVKLLKEQKNMFGKAIPSDSVGVVIKVYSSSIEVKFDIDGTSSIIQVKNEDAFRM